MCWKSLISTFLLVTLPYYKFKNKWTESNDENPPNTCMLAVFCIPSWHLISKRDEMKARVGGTRIFIALQTYKHKYGKYPDSLDTLQNKLGWIIPKDPFSDKQYHYMQKV